MNISKHPGAGFSPETEQDSVPKISRDLYLENECVTNRTVGLIILLFSLFPLVNSLSFLYDYSSSLYSLNTRILWPLGILMWIIVFIAWLNKFRPTWIKYMFLATLLLFCGTMFFIFSNYMGFIFLVPVFVAVRYFSKRIILVTFWHSVVELILICVSNMVLERTSETIRQLHVWLTYNPWVYVNDSISYILVPMLLTTLFIGIYSFGISANGMRLMGKQMEISERILAVQTELNTASEIHRAVLPAGEFHCRDGSFYISAEEIPVKEVGGDFYDWFMPDDHTLVTLIADVSDKGLPAAMFAMSAKKALACALECSHSLEEGMKLANRLICENNDPGMFLTLWLGMIDTRTGMGKYINAGHLPPCLRHGDGTVERIENDPDLFLGTFPEVDPRINLFRMREGDTLLLYTDGVTDAINKEGCSYDNERLLERIRSAVIAPAVEDGIQQDSAGTDKEDAPMDYTAKNLREAVIHDVQDFANGAGQYDDITVLALHCRKLQEPAVAELNVRADSQGTEQFISEVTELLDATDCPEQTRNNIGVIVDEICCNICSYAYADDSGSTAVPEHQGDEKDESVMVMNLRAEVGGNCVTLVFTDSGIAFDPLAQTDPQLSEEPQFGGLGIYFVRNLADSMEYRRDNGKNILTVTVIWNI